MSMLKIKSTPNHKYSIFIELSENVDPEWCLGRVDKDGNFIENEVECEIDDKKALIKMHDYFKYPFDQLTMLSFILKLGYGFDGKMCQKILVAKYGNKINAKTEITVILYQLIEIT